MFACTFIKKIVYEDSYSEGELTELRTVFVDSLNMSAPTVKELFAKVGAQYGLDIDKVWIPEEGGIENFYCSWDRIEDAEGSEPTKAALTKWEAGEVKLWCAHYTFGVEYRDVRGLRVEDFVSSGMEYHA